MIPNQLTVWTYLVIFLKLLSLSLLAATQWSPSLPYFPRRSGHWAPLDPLKSGPSASRSPAAGQQENCFSPTSKMINLQECAKYIIMTLTLLSFSFTGFVSCKMSTYLMTDLYNIVHDDIISWWFKMSRKQEFIILWPKCFYQVMSHLKRTWNTCGTCRCPSLSRLLQQRVEGSRQHILHVTSADSENRRTGWTSLFCLLLRFE